MAVSGESNNHSSSTNHKGRGPHGPTGDLSRRAFIRRTGAAAAGLSAVIPAPLAMMQAMAAQGRKQPAASELRLGPSRELKSSELQRVLFTEVHVEDAFWSPRIETVQEVTLPKLLDKAEEQGKIDNFRIIAGLENGEIQLYNQPDSDVYKLLEAAAYTLAWQHDRTLEQRVNKIISAIAAAQAEGGYLHTQFMLPFSHPASPSRDNEMVQKFGYGPDVQWQSTIENWPYGYGQLYCAGHLMEAAVAHYRATDTSTFLKVATKLADCIGDAFTLEKIKSYADHPQVGIGLFKLYEVIGDDRYLKMADQFTRYLNFTRPIDLHREENSKPLHKQRHAYGHCVRTAYIYSGATDVIRATGADDLREAISSLWECLAGHKMYVHGGTGNDMLRGEQYGPHYELPIRHTYSECCANIAQGQWNHRLNLLTGDAKYADLVELEAYNAALAGISLDGKRFAYQNPLNIGTENRKGRHSGVRTFYLFCCPSKLPGFVGGIGRWIYAKDEDGLYVNLFIGSEVRTEIAGEPVQVKQETEYPWKGRVTLTVGTPGTFALNLRLPGWGRADGPNPTELYYFETKEKPSYAIRVNGRPASPDVTHEGYVRVRRRWQPGDQIELTLDMPVRRLRTIDHVEANQGRVALMRGPLLYALEGVDNDFDVLMMALPKDNSVAAQYRPDLLGGVVTLTGRGRAGDETPVEFTAVPYYAWQNRGIYALATLLIEDPNLTEPEVAIPTGEVNTNG